MVGWSIRISFSDQHSFFVPVLHIRTHAGTGQIIGVLGYFKNFLTCPKTLKPTPATILAI
jgi:hypothetical protein